MYLYVALVAFLCSQCSSALESTTDRYTEIDFNCLFGDIEDDCIEGESGNKRFTIRNASIYSCKSVEEFFGKDNQDPYSVAESRLKKRSENKIFACASYFEWELHTDTNPREHNFEEIHTCLFDTGKNLKASIKGASPDGCVKATDKWQTLKLSQKKCLCFRGNSCNSKFNRGFKKEPSGAKSLCRQKKITEEEDYEETTTSLASTTICLTILNFSLSLLWLF